VATSLGAMKAGVLLKTFEKGDLQVFILL